MLESCHSGPFVWSKDLFDVLYVSFAWKYGVAVYRHDGTCSDSANRSWTYGSDHIVIGEYDDPELECLSFFHELGHCTWEWVPFQEWPYPHYSEVKAWKAGLSVASERGIHFSLKALEWASEQLASYFREGEDGSPPCYLREAQKEAGLPYLGSTTKCQAG